MKNHSGNRYQKISRPADHIIFALDMPSFEAARTYIDLLSGRVGMFKVGLELFIQAGPGIVQYIHELGKTGVFLDLKLHDIPATVSRAMKRIADLGVVLTTVHCGENPAMLEAAAAACGQVGVLGVTVLTSVSGPNLLQAGFKAEYADQVKRLVQKRAEAAKDAGCAGVVCSGSEVEMIKKRLGRQFLAVTPGIRPADKTIADDDQQRITTPGQAIRDGADYLVIGRPIQHADDPRRMVRRIAAEIESAGIHPGNL
ncbi:MAG: orotidine-5'-phosphate decarboxylase [Thermodesulfobacteriota bacterium]|nr:orotidine-5'-phosphate decarboxylase [Thermodesulfobacteriota bacterium]